MTLDDGTHVAVTTLEGGKSGFKGKVWVWAPKQYFDPKYENSGFPAPSWRPPPPLPATTPLVGGAVRQHRP